MVAAETDATNGSPRAADDADGDDPAVEDAAETASGDAVPQNLLTGAALYIVQPQEQPTPPAGEEVAAQSAAGAATPPVPDMPAPVDTGAEGAEATDARDAAQAAAAVQTAAAQSTSTKASTASAMQQALAELEAEASDTGPVTENPGTEKASAAMTTTGEAPPSNASAARSGNAGSAAPTVAASPTATPSTPDPKAAAAQAQAPTGDAATAVQTTTAAEPAAAVLADAPSASTGPDALPTTAQGQTTLSTQTPAPVVQTSLSSLSRATIETTAQIAAQITRRLEGRATRFEMALTPDDLGRVDVSLDIDADGQLVARLAFDNPLAATELRGRADELRGQLEDAGFTLARDALDFSQRDASSGGGFDRRQNRAFASATRLAAQADATAQATPAAWVSLNLTPRGVDMKV